MRTATRAACISAVLVVCVLAINLYIFSPWHWHTPKQLCAFSSFEHGNGTEAISPVQVVPPAVLAWLPAAPDPLLRATDIPIHYSGRAPPA
ncbi:MAG TPA: hypothetical protein PLA43_12085 [Bryobacteraceae bacterium]|nr:hypothetical protein [Bryobacteraceae bacterium]HOL70695.1 hypothetical protein [Bryobacteraceae bacterium]HOQ46170.1 hypothetical protein [Bryobacteraceae bacterium]HPU72689.1 hypothetical protein [Bryobacteraceae bacterium]